MFDFVWHLRGSVPLDGGDATDADVLDNVAYLLSKQQKGVIERAATYLAFDDPLWRNLYKENWRAMAIYERGRFWIDQDMNGRFLRYDLRSLNTLVFCLIGVVISFLFGLAGGGLVMGLLFGVAAFAWLYGINALLALVRVPLAIRKAANFI